MRLGLVRLTKETTFTGNQNLWLMILNIHVVQAQRSVRKFTIATIPRLQLPFAISAILVSILAPDKTHLVPDLKIHVDRIRFDFTFYPKVAFGYRSGSFHSKPFNSTSSLAGALYTGISIFLVSIQSLIE
jgi:hypothetical protein